MYKIFLTIMFTLTLSAELIDGVAVVVKGNAITLYEIEKEMELLKVDATAATDALIRKATWKSRSKRAKNNS